jgi:hypothetical protein
MKNFCSFKYSRDDAKKVRVEEINDEVILNLLNDFKDKYKKLIEYLNEEEDFKVEEKFLEFKDDIYLSDLCLDISGEKNNEPNQ